MGSRAALVGNEAVERRCRTLESKVPLDQAAVDRAYRTYARELGRQLQPWQRRVVRALVVKTYAPVGARRAKHEPTLGRTLIALGEDPDDPTIAVLTRAIVQEVLADGDDELPLFVRRAMVRCVESAREADADLVPVAQAVPPASGAT